MSTSPGGASPSDADTQVLRAVDQICDRFEAARRACLAPRIEDYLEGAGDSMRPRLLRELVALDVACRRADGERISFSHYESRFPNDVATVREGFTCGSSSGGSFSQPATTAPASAARTPGRLTIRCPSCHAPMEVAVDAPLADLACAACGSNFSLVDQGPASRKSPPLSQLGRFDLIERLGVGSFGSVWKARDTKLDRIVAIKIPRQQLMTAEEQDRFLHEARAAAQLHHANIVSVHEVGRDGDSIYIVTDLVPGATLSEWLAGQTLTAREAAGLCVKIADALQHAHEQGVIHRDLKPANIMIDVAGEPHLMDFGLARRDVAEVTVTLDGQILGTPAYMSPEQAQGEAHLADSRSDVYSLGVIVFQLLTGELPFRGNPRMLIHQVINDEPPSPRQLNAHVPKDLETITLKCLEKVPGRRYPAAGAVADELRRWLHGEPIQARPLGRFEKASRWTRKHPLEVTLAAIIASLAVGGPLVAMRQHQLLVEREGLTDFALSMLETPSRFDAGYDPNPLNVAELFQQAADRVRKRFAQQPAIAARLQFALATTLRDLGEYQSSADLAQASIELSRSANGPDSEATLMAERLLASCWQKQGRRAEALRKYLELAARAEQSLGLRHPAHLLLCTEVAILYAENQQLPAIDWIEKVVPHYSAVLPQEHPDHRFIANRIGWVYCMLGRYEDGRQYFEEALTLRRKYDGRLAHATLRVQHANLAWALTCLGRHDEAIAQQREALALYREKYPNDPRRWLWPQSYLIHRYVRAGRDDAAIAAAAEFLETCRACGEDPEQHDSWTIWELHDALYRQGRNADAKALAEQFNACLRRVLGEFDLAVYRSTLRHLQTAARYEPVEGEVERVVTSVRELFRSQRKLLGDEHAEVAETAEVLASGLAMAPTTSEDPWDELVEWFDPATAREPDNPWPPYQAAIVSLAQGDAIEYRRRCAALLTQFQHSQSMAAAERVVHACVAAPGSTPSLDEVVRLARITEQPRLMGAAFHRAQQYDQSLAEFDNATRAGHVFEAWDYAFRAMSLQRLGRDGEALQALLMAQQLSTQVSSWHEGVEVAYLVREAEALVDAEPHATAADK